MAELTVIMSMITVTSTAASLLGIIKRRCGASQAITDLANRCSDLVGEIQNLLETLEEGAQVPRDTRGISTVLNLRHNEFGKVLKNLEEMKQRTKRTYVIYRTVKSVMAQGWAKRMEAIHDDLVQVRSGIENIVLNWHTAQFVVKKCEEVETIDLTSKKESGSTITCTGPVTYVDRIEVAMVKLTPANKVALNQHGNLAKLSLPNALYQASLFVICTDTRCSIQLMQRSAELLHPLANWIMGVYVKLENLDLARRHFRVASSRPQMELHDHLNPNQNVLKYIKMASSVAMECWD